MALTIETGVGLADADALISVAEARTYAVSRGLTLPAADADVEVLIRQACDWLRSLEDRLQGWRRTAIQALPFPRIGVSLWGRPTSLVLGVYTPLVQWLPEEVIPPDIKNAICQMTCELVTKDALPTVDSKVVISETVGPISTTYANGGTTSQNPFFPKVLAFIQPFLKTGSPLTSVRA